MKLFRKNICAILFGLLIALIIGEIGLRLSGYCKTYSERRNGTYQDVTVCDRKNIWWRSDPGKDFVISTPEFSSSRHINSYGFQGSEYQKRADGNEVRILSLGDSFTFGDGAPEDSSYPAILEHILRDRFPGRKIKVYNAGSCGSDPIFGFVAYARLLRDIIDPDIIIQAFHTQDIRDDFPVRQGFERYDNDSMMSFKGIDFKWHLLYRYSHLSRLYFRNYCGYNEFFINEQVLQKSIPADIRAMRQLARYWNDTLRPNQQFFFLIQPEGKEIEQNRYGEYLQTVMDSMRPYMGRLEIIDFKNWLVDTYHISKPDILDIYWKKDGHHTPRGYSLMALSVADGLTPLLKKHFGSN